MPRKPKAPPDPLEAHLGFWIRFVSNHVSTRFQNLLQAQGSTLTEWVALRTLYDRPRTTPAELVEALGMTKGAASKVITRLEEKGLALRQLAIGSGRDKVLSLTDAGLALVPRLAAHANQNEEHFFGHLGSRERRALIRIFKGLVSHHQFKEIPVA
jgi:DNA-binding MarR family transcriptional regulator